MVNGHMRGYEAVKAMAKELGVNIPNLLVSARNNDPFMAGTPAQRERADWFYALWQDFGFTTGVHLRRVHYKLVSQHAPTRHDGKPYENTEECWNLLLDAGKMARYLGMVPADAFEDRRNPDPIIIVNYDELSAPALLRPEWIDFYLPSIQSDLSPDYGSMSVPAMQVTGYDYAPGAQPYHLEVWVEKSTMDDALLPVCRRHGVNLVRSLGFQSISSAVDLLKRTMVSGKPARVLYISDFDPAGDQMPVSVARQLEYWVDEYAPGADIKLQPLVLTREQVQQYRLPRIPIKESDRRKGAFEERHGEGAVELDALEALYPGELARIVSEAIEPYRDPDLSDKYYDTWRRAGQQVNRQWREMTSEAAGELATMRSEVVAIVNRYTDRLAAMNDSLQVELAPIAERLEFVRQAIQQAAEEFDPELPGLPEPEAPGQDEQEWLFDAGREYFDQLAVYKQRKMAEA